MEPIIIQVQLVASESLLSTVSKIADALNSQSVKSIVRPQAKPTTEPAAASATAQAQQQKRRATVHEPQAADAPQGVMTETQPKSAPGGDQISDPELREAVKAANHASSPSAVRQIFAEFGIATSIDCPQARRAELLSRLVDLANNAH